MQQWNRLLQGIMALRRRQIGFLPPVFDPVETFSSFILELQESLSSVALVPAVGALNSFAMVRSFGRVCLNHSDPFCGFDGSRFVSCGGLGVVLVWG